MTTRDATDTESWRGRRVVVLGMARSGRAVARLLARHGARVRGTDEKDALALGLDTGLLTAEGVELRLGGFRPEDLAGMELAVTSPGIPKTAPVLELALRLGIPVLSELEVAARFARAPMAAVTGTNGKSTTVTVLGQLVEALGKPAAVVGNVGRALSEEVESVPAEGVLVVEVSSYQLEDVETFHPRSAALLNLAPDHLDRYDSLDHYLATKVRIFARQGRVDTAVLPLGDARIDAAASDLSARLLRFGRGEVVDGVRIGDANLCWCERGSRHPILPLAELSLQGPHNHENFAAALCLLAGLGLDPLEPRVVEALRRARGLPHRLEPVGEVEGVSFVNDSKATNPDSLGVALRAFPGPIVLIAGGRPKQSGYRELAPLVAARVALVVLIGEAAPLLEEAWADAGVPFHHGGTDFEAAVRGAWEAAKRLGAPVVLSPGCASFDMFRDYEDRGDRFRALVRSWGGKG